MRDKENATQEVLFILSYSYWSSVPLHQCGLFFQKLPVRGMVLSAQFWPAFRDEKFELPQEMNDALQKHLGMSFPEFEARFQRWLREH